MLRLVRRPASGDGEIAWDPQRGRLDAESLEGVDAVVHLAGETIGGLWTSRAASGASATAASTARCC